MRLKLGRWLRISSLIMKTSKTEGSFSHNFGARLARTILLTGALLCAAVGTLHAQAPDPGGFTNGNYYGHPLMAWSFNDTNYWTDDAGYTPVSFTNLAPTLLGDGTAVVVDSTDPAWLQYNVTESSGTNNLKVDRGSVMFWFAPSWSGTNAGGTGPGVWGRLLEAGSVNSNGWWSLYVDPAGTNLYFSVQTNGGPAVTYLSASIEWTTNRWHHLALTCSATNSRLYLDGNIAATGASLTNFPGPAVLANGFFLGSDHAGTNQAHGMLDDIYTYDYSLNYGGIIGEYLTGSLTFLLNLLNPANISPSPPDAPAPVFRAITGAGDLQWQGLDSGCLIGTNVFIKHPAAARAGNDTMNVSLTISGGMAGGLYDVFATGALDSRLSNVPWSWLGQGINCGIYTLSIMNSTAFFILGTPLDSDEDGLSDAYEILVSHTDPHNPDSDGDGWMDGEEILNGTDPNVVDQPFKVMITRPRNNSNLP